MWRRNELLKLTEWRRPPKATQRTQSLSLPDSVCLGSPLPTISSTTTTTA